MKLAGGAGRLWPEMDEREFVRHIPRLRRRRHLDAQPRLQDAAYRTAHASVPDPARAELDAWYREGYESLAARAGLLE